MPIKIRRFHITTTIIITLFIPSQKSQGQVFDSFPCITWQMPVPLFSRFCRGIECLFTLYSAKIHIFLVTTKYSSSEGIKNLSLDFRYYNRAMDQRKSLEFQDRLKNIFY